MSLTWAVVQVGNYGITHARATLHCYVCFWPNKEAILMGPHGEMRKSKLDFSLQITFFRSRSHVVLQKTTNTQFDLYQERFFLNFLLTVLKAKFALPLLSQSSLTYCISACNIAIRVRPTYFSVAIWPKVVVAR